MKICPRCGKPNMKEKKVRNALSRHRDEYICSECGIDEALRDFYHFTEPEWFIDVLKQAI